ncbi:hypothetical protein [Lysobacter gummosus]|uniref:hypothetical protein n=1 Tax=Lysobacter gummosus TaxID=262324 RepID=UPI003641151D
MMVYRVLGRPVYELQPSALWCLLHVEVCRITVGSPRSCPGSRATTPHARMRTMRYRTAS